MTAPAKKEPKFRRLAHGKALDNDERQELYRDRLKEQGGRTVTFTLGPQATTALSSLVDLEGGAASRGSTRRAVESALINEAGRRAKAPKA